MGLDTRPWSSFARCAAGVTAIALRKAGWLLLSGPIAPAFAQPYVPRDRIDPARVNVLAAADAERSAGLSLATPVSHIKAEVVGWTRPDQSLRWTIEVPTRDAYAVSVLIGQRSGQAVELRVSADGASVTSGFRPDPRGSVDPHHVFRRRADRVQGLPALAEAIFRPFQELEARLLDPPADGPWKTPVLDRSAAEGLPGALGFGVVLPADQGALGVGV